MLQPWQLQCEVQPRPKSWLCLQRLLGHCSRNTNSLCGMLVVKCCKAQALLSPHEAARMDSVHMQLQARRQLCLLKARDDVSLWRLPCGTALSRRPAVLGQAREAAPIRVFERHQTSFAEKPRNLRYSPNAAVATACVSQETAALLSHRSCSETPRSQSEPAESVSLHNILSGREPSSRQCRSHEVSIDYSSASRTGQSPRSSA